MGIWLFGNDGRIIERQPAARGVGRWQGAVAGAVAAPAGGGWGGGALIAIRSMLGVELKANASALTQPDRS